MAKHFFKISMTYISKNHLQREISKYFQSIDCTLMQNDSELRKFKEESQEKVKQLHQEHPRCKEVKLEIWSLSGEDPSLRCGPITGDIFQVRHEINSKNSTKQ